MKCTIPEISWHNRDPVLSIDIQCKNDDCEPQRLATGGTDSHVLIWHIKTSEGSSTTVEVVADLTRHEKAVNVVRWSPSGELLASGDDESVIIIWKQRTDADPPPLLDQTTVQDRETWLTLKVLRGHIKDVYDLSWAPDSNFLITGSIDNTAMLWDVLKGRSYAILDDHKNFVQGVAWDPKNKYLATLSSDRTCRVFDVKSRKVISRSSKNLTQGGRLYHDDTLQSFFRRLCFSPDGVLLVVPSGAIDKQSGETINTTYVYTKYSFKQPVITLPSKEYSVAAKCCPLLFCLRYDNPIIPLPYRMVIAIATRCSVILYDTEQQMPFAVISNIHYTRLTDLAWSSDGCILAVSSTDGFCSIITFSENELGEIYNEDLVVTDKINCEMEICISEKDKKQVETKIVTPPKFSEFSEKTIDKNQTEPKITTPHKHFTHGVRKKATPIAIRRKPRVEIDSDQVAEVIKIKSNQVTKVSAEKDPGPIPETKHEEKEPESIIVTKHEIVAIEHKQIKVDEINVTTPKPPRRVQLITLSSPGCKKKLI